MTSDAPSTVLKVDHLSTVFDTASGKLPAVSDVSFEVGRNETVGIVGESGSGKTVLSRTVMGLQPRTNVEVTGSILLAGRQIVDATDREKRDLWGREVAMIFQDPMTALNPVMKVGKQIAESLHVRLGQSHKEARRNAIELLRMVGIPSPEERFKVYPNQLSGGMRQRVVIAIALSCGPQLLLADEPTTGLDVTIQSQILSLLSELQATTHMATILVTHDLGVVAHRTDRIMVMYAGRIVESGTTRQIFYNHKMPYTRALLSSTPLISNPPHTRLNTIEGNPPNLINLGPGCAFAPRCSRATDQCRAETPPLMPAEDPGHSFACWNPLEDSVRRVQSVLTSPVEKP